MRLKNHPPRDTYIGSSIACDVIGANPYGGGPAAAYAALVHQTEKPLSGPMRRGMLLEPGLLDYARKWRGRDHERDVFIQDDEIPFFGGTLDALETPDERVIIETTSTGEHSSHLWGVPGTDDVSRFKFAQAQWFLGVLPKAREVHVFVYDIDSSEEPQHYRVARNEAFISEMRERCEAFYFDHVLARRPPVPTVIDADADDVLGVLFPKPNGPVIDADTELVSAAHAYAAARDVEKAAEIEKKAAAARLKALLREHEGARWSGGSVSWKAHPLAAKVHWELVANELAQKANVSGEVFTGLIRENTYAAQSVRSLRVSVKKAKEEKT